jgi:hypothetical protein
MNRRKLLRDRNKTNDRERIERCQLRLDCMSCGIDCAREENQFACTSGEQDKCTGWDWDSGRRPWQPRVIRTLSELNPTSNSYRRPENSWLRVDQIHRSDRQQFSETWLCIRNYVSHISRCNSQRNDKSICFDLLDETIGQCKQSSEKRSPRNQEREEMSIGKTDHACFEAAVSDFC